LKYTPKNFESWVFFLILRTQRAKQTNLTVDITKKHKNQKDYYLSLCMALSGLVKKDNRLTAREAEFLSECCCLHQSGADLNDPSVIFEHFLGKGLLSDRQLISNYKTRLGIKKWVETGYKKYQLPKMLREKPNGFNIELRIEDGEEE